MHINIWHDTEVKKVPKAIQEYMRHRFGLLPEYLELLRCFEYDGQVDGKQVRFINIFSPNRAQEKNVIISIRQDLAQHPEMLLYEGYTDNQRNIYMTDRRVPIMKAKVA